MPPWGADPDYGEFSNDRSLSQREVETLVSWVEAGAIAGDPADAPPPLHFREGWKIGEPDVVLTMPKPFTVPAEGKVEYQYVVFPSGFTEGQVRSSGSRSDRATLRSCTT